MRVLMWGREREINAVPETSTALRLILRIKSGKFFINKVKTFA